MTEQQRQSRLEAQTRYRAKHPERIKASKERYAAEHPDAAKDSKRKYGQSSKGRATNAAYQRHWRKTNPERAAELMRQDRKKRAEKIDAYNRQWKLDHPERTRTYRSTSKARRRSRTQGRLSPGLVKQLWQLQHARCACCQNKLSAYELDHIQPLHLGGPHEDANIQLLCPRCNGAKSCKDPIAFMREQGKLL